MLRTPEHLVRARAMQTPELGRAREIWYWSGMRRQRRSITTSYDIVQHIDGLTEANFKLLTMLISRLAEIEKRRRKYMTCVLIRLSKIETMLTEVQGCQLADFWPPGKVRDEERIKHVKELKARMESASEQMGLKMTRFIYGEDQGPEGRHDRRRKWWGWEI